MIKTTEEVAALLVCSAETIELAARQGTLPGLQFDQSWVFPEEALYRALNSQAMAAAYDRSSKVDPAKSARAAIKPIEGREFGPLRAAPPTLPTPERA